MQHAIGHMQRPAGLASRPTAETIKPLRQRPCSRKGVVVHCQKGQTIDTPQKVLIIGCTGVTGKSAVRGLLQSKAASPSSLQLVALTRNTSSPAAAALRAQSIDTVAGDLDNAAALAGALEGVDTVYCHALSSDAAKADPKEVLRAQQLAQAAAAAGVKLIVYNSSGGRDCGYGISQMEQKHRVEDIFDASGVPLTALRVAVFMEEFWKKYTRPSIITKGSFPMALPPNKKLQLLAASDIGLVAGSVLLSPQEWQGKAIELAGDELTPLEMVAAFTRAQPSSGPSPVRHDRMPAWPFFFLNQDLWKLNRFLSEKGYSADVAALRQRFPGLMTFDQFLAATRWNDGSRSYETGIEYDGPASSPATVPARVLAKVA